MRIMFGMAALAAAVALGGCQSDATVMAETRKQVGDSCRSSPLPGVDLDSYCTCVVDKSVGSKSVAELKKMSEQEGQALGMKAAGECLAQQNPPAATAAAPTTEGPSEATKETGEAVEEAVDDAN